MTVIKIDDPQYARTDRDGLLDNEATLGRDLAAVPNFLDKSSSSSLSKFPVVRPLLDDILVVSCRDDFFFFFSPREDAWREMDAR